MREGRIRPSLEEEEEEKPFPIGAAMREGRIRPSLDPRVWRRAGQHRGRNEGGANSPLVERFPASTCRLDVRPQ